MVAPQESSGDTSPNNDGMRSNRGPEFALDDPALKSGGLHVVQEESPEKAKSGSEIINGVEVYVNKYAADHHFPKDIEDTKAEIDGALQDLDDNDLKLLQSKGFAISIKDSSPTRFNLNTREFWVHIRQTGNEILEDIKNIVLPQLRGESKQESEPALSPKIEEKVEAPEVQSDILSPLGQEGPVVEAEHAEVPRREDGKVDVAEMKAGDAIPVKISEKETPESDLTATKILNPEPMVTGEKVAIVPPENDSNEELSATEKLDKLRTAKAGVERDFKEGKVSQEYLDEINKNYEAQRENVSDEIKNSLRMEKGENLTPEQEETLKSEINDKIFEELVAKEYEAYMQAIKADREETLVDKGLNLLKKGASTKFGKWWLGLDRETRAAITTGATSVLAVGIGVGAGVGVGAALGYGGYKLARGVSSFMASSGASMIGNKIWSAEELQKKREEEFNKIKSAEGNLEEKTAALGAHEKYFNKKERNMVLKKAALTAGTGAGVGVLNGLSDHIFNLHETNTSIPQSTGAGKAAESLSNGPKVTPEVVRVPAPALEAEKIFADHTEILHAQPKAGDGLWKLLSRALEQDERFAHLAVGQKQSFLAHYVNKAIADAEGLGLTSDPKFGVKIELGKEVDLSHLFNDEQEFNNVMARVGKLTADQQTEIVNRSGSIEEYLKLHPNEELTVDKVKDILATKPPTAKIEIPIPETPQPIKAPVIVDAPLHAPEYQMPDNPKNASSVVETPHTPKAPDAHFINTINTLDPQAASAFNNGVNSIYGKASNIFGFGGMDGLKSPNWAFVKGLNAAKMLEYFGPDSNKSAFASNIAAKLAESDEHVQLYNEMRGLMSHANIKPFETDTVESFLKKLTSLYVKSQPVMQAA